jgi:hypothetical protein
VNDLVGQLATAVKISMQRLNLSNSATYATVPLVPLTGFIQLAAPLGSICVLWVAKSSAAAAAGQMATRTKVERQILASGVCTANHVCDWVCMVCQGYTLPAVPHDVQIAAALPLCRLPVT